MKSAHPEVSQKYFFSNFKPEIHIDDYIKNIDKEIKSINETHVSFVATSVPRNKDHIQNLRFGEPYVCLTCFGIETKSLLDKNDKIYRLHISYKKNNKSVDLLLRFTIENNEVSFISDDQLIINNELIIKYHLHALLKRVKKKIQDKKKNKSNSKDKDGGGTPYGFSTYKNRSWGKKETFEFALARGIITEEFYETCKILGVCCKINPKLEKNEEKEFNLN